MSGKAWFRRALSALTVGLIALTVGAALPAGAAGASGTVQAWGDNGNRELGYGGAPPYYSTTPQAVVQLADVVAVAAGHARAAALKSDGTVWGWGDGGAVPAQVTPLNSVVAVSAGGSHSLALRGDGTVWGWGSNAFSQLGLISPPSATTAVPVVGLVSVAAVAAGGRHSLALLRNGTVWAWGGNDSGQLGTGTSLGSVPVPARVSGIDDVVAISAGGTYSLALKADGTVWAWGNNDTGQLGDGTTVSRTSPVQASGLSGVVAISADPLRYNGGVTPQHSVALTGDGTVWTWGENSSGELGDGTTVSRPTAAPVAGVAGGVAVAAGGYHTAVLLSDGSVSTWGSDAWGQLGDGFMGPIFPPVSGHDRATPGPVSGLSGVAAIAAGGRFNLALLGPTPPIPSPKAPSTILSISLCVALSLQGQPLLPRTCVSLAL